MRIACTFTGNGNIEMKSGQFEKSISGCPLFCFCTLYLTHSPFAFAVAFWFFSYALLAMVLRGTLDK